MFYYAGHTDLPNKLPLQKYVMERLDRLDLLLMKSYSRYGDCNKQQDVPISDALIQALNAYLW